MAAKKMASVAFTPVYKVFTIRICDVEHSFAIPQLVVLGARSPLASLLIQEIHQQMERIIKHNKNGKCALQNLSRIIFNYLYFFAMNCSIERKPRLYCVKQRPESRLLQS
jgi:hypothetical protein